MKLGVPKETRPRERRVAVTPETAKKLVKLGFVVQLEQGAGEASDFADAEYVAAGAVVVDTATAWASDLVVKVDAPTPAEAARLGASQSLLSFLWPDDNPESFEALKSRGVRVFATERVPRIARAQKMDVLSSMGNLAGYKAVLEAANHFGRYLPMLMTAAGTIPPAHVMIVGVGVAGLSAIATARRLGAVVRAFDTRPAVRDQVRSLGARFLDMDLDEAAEDAGGYAKELSHDFIEKEMALLAKNSAEVDIVITTALVAGKKAPTLITADMVKGMKPGSVIVDLAAAKGGNCELTVADEAVVRHGVTLLGFTDLPSRMATDASRLLARNLYELIAELKGKVDVAEGLRPDPENVVVQGVTALAGAAAEAVPA